LLTCPLDGIAAATVGSILNYLLLGLAPQLDRFYLHSFEILLACTVVFPGLGNLGFTLLEYRLGHRNFFAALIENLRWVPFLYAFSLLLHVLCTNAVSHSLFFFGGLSIHLSTAILAHLFSYDMYAVRLHLYIIHADGPPGRGDQRSKRSSGQRFGLKVRVSCRAVRPSDTDVGVCSPAVPRIWQRFKLSFIICFMVIVMMIVMQSDAVPFEWQIPGWNWALNIPLSLVVGTHVLLPVRLAAAPELALRY
jgi:hypothetical protein